MEQFLLEGIGYHKPYDDKARRRKARLDEMDRDRPVLLAIFTL
jgi:hypothetical protein